MLNAANGLTAEDLKSPTTMLVLGKDISFALNVPAQNVDVIAVYSCPGDSELRWWHFKRRRRLASVNASKGIFVSSLLLTSKFSSKLKTPWGKPAYLKLSKSIAASIKKELGLTVNLKVSNVKVTFTRTANFSGSGSLVLLELLVLPELWATGASR